ncbi:hypothetical protein CDD83_5738 [Cordyceps sp. RAO-2017]|nr:hypothetical protein CDD83_5738 [Cordyceps sp. RAO-2017]
MGDSVHVATNAHLLPCRVLRLLEALLILDCYRAILLQRPPTLLWGFRGSFCDAGPGHEDIAVLFRLAAEMTTPALSIDKEAVRRYSLTSIASLSPHLWPVMRTRFDRDADSPRLAQPGHPIWKRDFVALALEKWRGAQDRDVEPSSLILYHLMNLTLHADIDLMQRLFRSSFRQQADRDQLWEQRTRALSVWVRSRECEVASWHARSLLRCAEEGHPGHQDLVPSDAEHQAAAERDKADSLDEGEAAAARKGTGRPQVEAPHVPYAVFFATVALWLGAMVAEEGHLATQAHLARGRAILSRHRSRAARQFAKMLESTQSCGNHF